MGRTSAVGLSTALVASLLLFVPGTAQSSAVGGRPHVVERFPLIQPQGLAVSAQTNSIVAAAADGKVSIIGRDNFKPLAEISTGIPRQTRVQLGLDGSRAYVLGSEPIVSVLDLVGRNLITQIPLNSDDRNAAGSVITRAEIPLLLVSYRAASRKGAISIISTATNFNRLTGEFPVETAGLAFPNLSTLVMAGFGDGRIYFLDSFFQPIAEVNVGGTPDEVVSSADGARLYVSNPARENIAIIQTLTPSLVSEVDLEGEVSSIALTSDEQSLLAVLPNSGELVVVDVVTGRTISRTKVGVEPVTVVGDADARYAYLADRKGNALLKVDLAFVAPESPRRVRARAIAENVRVSWHPPAVQGSLPVTRYLVTTLPKGPQCSTRLTFCTLVDVEPGINYRVRVVATNSVAASAPVIRPVSREN